MRACNDAVVELCNDVDAVCKEVWGVGDGVGRYVFG